MSTPKPGSILQTPARRLKAFAACLFLSLAAGTPVVADDTEIFFSTDPDAGVKPNVLFILDTSGSMNWTDGQPKSRLERMKEALTTILSNTTNINVGLMRFNGSNGGGPVLFPLSYVDQDVCEIESCASAATHSVSVSVSQDSDDAEEVNASGVVTLDNEALHLVGDESLSGATTTTLELDTADDMEERSNNTLHSGSPDLDLFYAGGGGNHLGVGVKFSSVTIPAGATITSAEIEFWTKEKGKNNLDVDIYGDDSDNANEWLELAGYRVTDRTKTTAKVDWNNLENRKADRSMTTPDLATIVQEIVDRPGWTNGNDMGFLLFVDGTSNSKNYRIFYSEETGGSTYGPKLRVTYQTSAGGADVSQTVGLRFDGVDVPQGATITSAYLEFEASEVASDAADLAIRGEKVANPSTYANTSNHISNRMSATTTSVAWSAVESWDTIGNKFQSPDISVIVQELVNQTDFCGGNAMAFFLTGTGTRLAMAHEGSGIAPTLKVTYSTDSLTAGQGCMRKTITKTIARDSDDAEEDKTDGAVSTGSSDLELITDGSEEQLVGLRFQELDIAQGATITEANLEFEIDEAGSGSVNLKISGQDVDDAGTFTGSNENISDRVKTSAYITWNVTDDPAVNASLTSPDLKTIVQEIVDRAGWTEGNDMAFIIEKSSGTGKRIVEARDGEADAAARLTIQVEWNEGDQTSTVQTVRSRLINEVSNIDAAGGTPIVDALYEGALYYRGENVDYGKQRGTSSTSSDAKVHRVSHPASYTGGTLVRDAGCTDSNLSATECKTEHIDPTPVYVSPITDSCQTSHIVFMSDGEPTSNSSAAKVKTMAGISSCTNSGNEACGAELATFLSEDDQSSLTGLQKVKIYSVGFALDSGSDAGAITFLKSLATDGDAGYYTASSSADLVNAFDSILAEIITVTSTFVAPGAAVNQFNRLIHDDEIYFSLFKPGNRPFWNGNLKKYRVTTDALLDKNGNEAVDPTTGLFKDSAQSYWSSSADGNEVIKGGAAAQRSSSASRKVYTYVSGSSTTTLSHVDNKLAKTNALVSTTVLGLSASDTTLRENILDWASGIDLKDYDEDGITSEVRLQYGDPLHSKPVIITYGGTADAPDNTIFFGSNEGYLHAVDSDDGSEVFSFIPEELLPNLEDLYTNSSSTTHAYGMDGTVVIWTHDDNGDNDYYDTTGGVNDHVYLYAGMRRGGKSYYAMNVTDRSNPKYLWKITGGSGTYAEMAQTWSIPVKTKVNINGTTYDVLVIGGGYDDDQDNTVSHTTRQVDTEGRAIFMINAVNGNLVWQGAYTGVTGASESFADMKYSIPSEIRVIDINLDGYVDMMFAADMGGQVWRFDVTNGAASAADLVKGGVIADFGADSDTANNRRFYTTPDIALVKQGASKFLTVALGSGWRAHPLNKAVTDRFYLFRDSYWGSAPTTYTKLTESNLVDVTDTVDAAAIASAITGGKKGWYITLENAGEKVLSTSVTVNNQVIFSTYTPEAASASCSASQGTGRTYVVSVYDGRPTVNFDTVVSSDPNNLTVEDRVITLQRSGIPPEATVLFAPDPVVLIGPEMPLSDLPFGDIAQRTYWYQQEE